MKTTHFLIRVKNGEPPIGITMTEEGNLAALAFCSPDEKEGYDFHHGEMVAGGRAKTGCTVSLIAIKVGGAEQRLARYLLTMWYNGDIPRWCVQNIETPNQRGYYINGDEFVENIMSHYVHTLAEHKKDCKREHEKLLARELERALKRERNNAKTRKAAA